MFTILQWPLHENGKHKYNYFEKLKVRTFTITKLHLENCTALTVWDKSSLRLLLP